MHKSTSSGYTLVELLLYVGILGSLLLTLTYFFTETVDSRLKNQSIVEVEDQGTAVMDYVTNTIHNASSITAPTAGNSAASLTLVVPTGVLSPTIFNLSGSTFQVQEGAPAPISLTDSKVQMSSLTFKNLTRAGTTGTVQVSFTLSRLNTASRNEYDYQKTFTGTADIAR